jgi:hypothetical protein
MGKIKNTYNISGQNFSRGETPLVRSRRGYGGGGGRNISRKRNNSVEVSTV